MKANIGPGIDPEAPFHALVARVLAGEAALAVPPGFVAWADAHRLAPYLWHVARERSPAVAEALKSARVRAAAIAATRDPHRLALIGALAEAGMPPIVFKGLGVAHLVYPEPDLRTLGDLDLLFFPADIPRVEAVALALGYRHENDDPVVIDYRRRVGYNVPFFHPEAGLFEAHHALYRDCEPSFVDEIRSRVVSAKVMGLEVQTLARRDLFLTLAVHFAINGPGELWVWLLDLALLARNFEPGEWNDVVRDARRHGFQLFVLAATAWLGQWGIPLEARALESDLRPRERSAYAALQARGPRGLPLGDRLCVARRMSGRAVRGELGVLSSLFCHPGAVANELRVRSDAPFFWFHRLRHVGVRFGRAWRARAG